MKDGCTDSAEQLRRRKEWNDEVIAEQLSDYLADGLELDELSQSLVDLGPSYMWRLSTISKYKRSVQDVRDMVEDNWAEVPEELLRE
ncbi:hypothetical protein FRC10_012270 [Ceratobasidium sp. 414]|nr:hypothetical protein FRC10_012270 [Ceratobasidium sp. 414]